MSRTIARSCSDETYGRWWRSLSGLEGVSATLAGRRLGILLRGYRTRLGALRVVDVAKAAGVSQPTWSQVETSVAVPGKEQLECALRLLEVEGAEADEMQALRDRAKRREWWYEYDDVANPAYLKFIGYEASAVEILQCTSGWIPGLLQTPAVARAIFSMLGSPVRPENVDRTVAVRVRRQRILENPGLRFHVICGEEALRYIWGSPAILQEQLLYLRDLAHSRPNVTFQAVPFSAGPHLGHSNPYAILRFENPLDSPIVSFDSAPVTSMIVDTPAELRRWRYVFDELQRTALPPEGTVRLIESIIEELAT
jgi:hypothetical protein